MGSVWMWKKMNAFLKIKSTGSPVKFPESDFDLAKKWGWAFPKSYIEFIKQYGYGRVCGRFIVYPPMGDFPDSFQEQTLILKQNLLSTIKNTPNYAWQVEPDGSYDLIQRSIPFARSENGEILLWDAAAPDLNGEFPIYIHGAGAGVRRLPNHFADVLAMFSSPQDFKKYLPFDEEPLPLTFESFGDREWRKWINDKEVGSA